MEHNLDGIYSLFVYLENRTTCADIIGKAAFLRGQTRAALLIFSITTVPLKWTNRSLK